MQEQFPKHEWLEEVDQEPNYSLIENNFFTLTRINDIAFNPTSS